MRAQKCVCGYRKMVVRHPSKVETRVRFPLPAPECVKALSRHDTCGRLIGLNQGIERVRVRRAREGEVETMQHPSERRMLRTQDKLRESGVRNSRYPLQV